MRTHRRYATHSLDVGTNTLEGIKMDNMFTEQGKRSNYRRTQDLVAPAELVDFVDEHQGIAAVGFLQALNGLARHGADISAAVALDFGYVTQPPNAEPEKLAAQSVGHGLGNGCLAHTLLRGGGQWEDRMGRWKAALAAEVTAMTMVHP